MTKVEGESSHLLADLSELIAGPGELRRTGERDFLAVAFFDLVGSTARKLEQGHLAGIEAVTRHNATCRTIAERLGGRVIKELGDGVLLTFEDPANAALAALNVRVALAQTELDTKIGITAGLVELVQIDGLNDVIGSAVDRCARIQSLAAPGQILLDTAIVDAIRPQIADHDALELRGPEHVPLAGVGTVELWLLADRSGNGPAARLIDRLRFSEEGRVPVAEKAEFIGRAQVEVLELGIGIRTFTSYFRSLAPSLFKGPMFDAIARGVVVRCYALDPDSDKGRTYLADRGEEDYVDRARQALRELAEVRDEAMAPSPAGAMEIYLYDHVPMAHVLGIDLGAEGPDPDGQMMASPYLFGLPRAETPVMRFSARSNATLYSRWWAAVRALTADARLLD
jgi:class 3 adenylate cyclase